MLTFSLDSQSQLPLYVQIYQKIQQQILEGTLTAGSKLPSTRSLSTHLGVSRNTVDTAYYQLQAEGYIDAAPKSGFYVCDNRPEQRMRQTSFSRTSPGDSSTAPPMDSSIAPSPDKPAEKQHSPSAPDCHYDFSPSAIDISHFPFSVWKKLSRQCLMEEQELFLLGENAGDASLRQAICDYVRFSRQVQCEPEQIIVGAGVDFLLQMLSITFRQQGLTEITMENPGYMQAAYIFRNNGLNLSAGSLDERGLTLSSLSPETQIAYVTPSHQYPLGIVMPFGRRKELLSWAGEAPDRYIIEDDHDSEFRYKGKPIPSLQGMDQQERVIYMGTFSKAITPAIRVGYLILPPSLLPSYQRICGHYSCTVSRLDQAILSRFLSEGYFEKHLNRMRKIYRRKHDLVLSCLQPLLEQYGLRIRGENAGLHLVLELPSQGPSEEELIHRAAQAGIRLYGLRQHYLHDIYQPISAVLLGYSNLSEEEIKKGICRMADTQIFSL